MRHAFADIGYRNIRNCIWNSSLQAKQCSEIVGWIYVHGLHPLPIAIQLHVCDALCVDDLQLCIAPVG
jgi:hypothetical protein